MARVRVGAATDIGRHRSLNEDTHVVGRSLFAVIDGMGGHAAGDVASRVTAEALQSADRVGLGVVDLSRAIDQANAAVLDHVEGHPECQGMGAAVAGIALVTPGGQAHWAIFHIGDSRVYLLQGSAFRQVTVDHSEVQELLDAGVLDPEQARVHPSRHILTRAIGESSSVVADMVLRPVTAGQRVLIASDGLTSEVADSAIESVLRSAANPQQAADLLVKRALEAGGHDNVTVLVIDVEPATAASAGLGSNTVPRRTLLREDRG